MQNKICKIRYASGKDVEGNGYVLAVAFKGISSVKFKNFRA
jgi:hypothetical protein